MIRCEDLGAAIICRNRSFFLYFVASDGEMSVDLSAFKNIRWVYKATSENFLCADHMCRTHFEMCVFIIDNTNVIFFIKIYVIIELT